MRPPVLLIAALLACALVTPALSAPACKGHGDATNTNLALPAGGEVADGLKVALQLGVEPPTPIVESIRKNPDPCQRGFFKAGETRFNIFGDDGDSPVRWAVEAGGQRLVYLATIPDPIEALAWSKRRQADANAPALFTHSLYALVVADADRRLIYRYSRVIPDDYHLALYMRAALEGRWTPVSEYNVRTRVVDLSHLGKAGTQEADDGLAPGFRPERFAEPDGVFFHAQPDGAGRHEPSGLLCPKDLGEFRRTDLAVLNPAEGGVDVFCRYFTSKGWISVFDTRYADKPLDRVFEDYLAEAHRSTPLLRSLPAPGEVVSRSPMKANFWQGQEGGYQAMWVVKNGPWYVEIRATYQAGEEGHVAGFAQSMIDLLGLGKP